MIGLLSSVASMLNKKIIAIVVIAFFAGTIISSNPMQKAMATNPTLSDIITTLGNIQTQITGIQTTDTAIKTKTDNLQPDPASNSHIDTAIASIPAGASQLSVNNLQTTANAIKSKTDNLPSNPSSSSDITNAQDQILAGTAQVRSLTMHVPVPVSTGPFGTDLVLNCDKPFVLNSIQIAGSAFAGTNWGMPRISVGGNDVLGLPLFDPSPGTSLTFNVPVNAGTGVIQDATLGIFKTADDPSTSDDNVFVSFSFTTSNKAVCSTSIFEAS